MAAISLLPAVLSLADDPSQSVAALTASRSESLEVPGEVRRMAGGRLRVVNRAGSAVAIGVTFPDVTADDVALLKSWAGRVVLYRDSWGKKVYGTYFALNVVDETTRTRRGVSLTLTEATYSEAV